jgi:hypothetical protein|tara:strand:+ start:1356 stop:1718 length:363 start_codon:yes stop_codon:yes gene_type:complete
MVDKINFTQQINDSVQVGDILYFANVSPTDPTQANGPVTEIGPITAVGKNFVEVASGAPAGFTEAQIETGVAPPLFMFRKNNEVNISTLVGYFAEVELSSSNTGRSELYNIGSEIFVSSK